MPALLVVAIGMWLNNRRIDDLRRGFESLEKLTGERLRRVEERYSTPV